MNIKKLEKYYTTIFLYTCFKNFVLYCFVNYLVIKSNLNLNNLGCILIVLIFIFKTYTETKKQEIEFYKIEQQEDIKNILIDIKNGKN